MRISCHSFRTIPATPWSQWAAGNVDHEQMPTGLRLAAAGSVRATVSAAGAPASAADAELARRVREGSDDAPGERPGRRCNTRC